MHHACLNLSSLIAALMICCYLTLPALDTVITWLCLPLNPQLNHLVPFCVTAGVPVVQHSALPRLEEDHPLDSLDPGQHLGQRRALRAALPLHVQGSHPGPQPAGGGQTEDRDAVLLQWWIHWLLHWRWVESGGRDRWFLSSNLSLSVSESYLTPTGLLHLCRLVTGLLASSYSVFSLAVAL